MKILMISNHLGVQSGVQRYVQNLLLHLDTAKYRVTLFVGQCPPDQASTAPALEAHGVEILAVPDNKKDRIRALAAHLRTHKDYDIIHYHTASKIGAPVCGMMRVLCPRAKIVVHSHIVYPPMTLTWRAAHLVYQLFADYFLGCGVAAGRFVFGDHIDAKPNFSVACNAVDAGRFHPDAAAPAGPYAAQITAAAYPVCVHLRRGDYQKPENAILQVCTPDYYARAVAAVRDEHPDAALFVFSDDIDWAREHLDTAGLPAVFLPRGEAVADLAFMQLCRGFVLSNSTYSWWAQYLAPAPDKQTWAPDKWYAHTKKTALYQDGWQLIKTSPSGLRPQARVEA